MGPSTGPPIWFSRPPKPLAPVTARMVSSSGRKFGGERLELLVPYFGPICSCALFQSRLPPPFLEQSEHKVSSYFPRGAEAPRPRRCRPARPPIWMPALDHRGDLTGRRGRRLDGEIRSPGVLKAHQYLHLCLITVDHSTQLAGATPCLMPAAAGIDQGHNSPPRQGDGECRWGWSSPTSAGMVTASSTKAWRYMAAERGLAL